MDIQASNIGFPRVGAQRELKKALENFWSGRASWPQLRAEADRIEAEGLQLQDRKGLDLVPAGDFCLYDQMLDAAVMYDVIPKRHAGIKPVLPEGYFSMARGSAKAPACEMTKWFDTNYHYIVPEFDHEPRLARNLMLTSAERAAKALGGKPFKLTALGPLTFVALGKNYDAKKFPALLEAAGQALHEALAEVLKARLPIAMVQIEEPALVMDRFGKSELKVLEKVYAGLVKGLDSAPLLLQTYFGAPAEYDWLIGQPFSGFGLDFVREAETMELLRTRGFPKGKILAAGMVDGRNVWRSDLRARLGLLQEIAEKANPSRLLVQPSCSLMFLPYSLKPEVKLDPEVRNWMAFAEERLDEVTVLTKGLREGEGAVAESLAASDRAKAQAAASPKRNRAKVRSRVQGLTESDFRRASPYASRSRAQAKALNLPLFPTTTIGSFPQTAALRSLRASYKAGKLKEEDYRRGIKDRIAHCVGIQEALGLDVLVHGEFERTDMVEHFGQNLDGFSFTLNGWVQSYGSRCVRPPIVHGDVERARPMTVDEVAYAQTLTTRPMKGMLTGPVTILNWSFVRNDIGRDQTAYQIGLAIRDEAVDLEKAGLKVVQIDEPALREGLPLKRTKQKDYVAWTVKAFRLSASGVQDATQIHTHMCYGEFQDVIQAIDDMDADVISVEASRSRGEAIEVFGKARYPREVGPGVYDIHSPRVPSKEEMLKTMKRCLKALPAKRLWVNPDCGLKTRGYTETIGALRNMVDAALVLRAGAAGSGARRKKD